DAASFNIDVQRSNDGGLTYADGFGEAIDPQTFPAAGGGAGSANIAGQLRIDQSSCSSGGNIYSIFVAPDSATENALGQPMRSVYVGVSDSAKLGLPAFLFTDHKIYTSPLGSPGAVNGTNQIFPALATDQFGYVYAVWSDQTDIYYSSSSDQGTTWTAPVRVNSGPAAGMANVFPWVAADANGHVVVTWLGANKSGNSNDATAMAPTCSDGTNDCWAQWNVYAAETVNGHDATPSFTQYTASDHVVHLGTVSTGGLGGAADRNLGDFFQVALDNHHRANITFSDDHVVSPLCTTQTPGHCSPSDPQSFRNGQPYFTYQLAANPAVATTGVCAGTPAPAPREEKANGGGQINSVQAGESASFGLVAQNQPQNASLSYHDAGAPNGALDVRSSNIAVPSVSFSGSCASVSGSAEVNKQPGYSYTLQACDNGNPGAGNDTFSINVSGPNFSYANSGKLSSGNIQVQSQ
ncbi:MAG TPA: post-COAP-1 domain-containing protein, partial [Terriglobales bacterium]|nr:post-COAP-1 domain-containing protein [Terriglobales bacterium]